MKKEETRGHDTAKTYKGYMTPSLRFIGKNIAQRYRDVVMYHWVSFNEPLCFEPSLCFVFHLYSIIFYEQLTYYGRLGPGCVLKVRTVVDNWLTTNNFIS